MPEATYWIRPYETQEESRKGFHAAAGLSWARTETKLLASTQNTPQQMIRLLIAFYVVER
jgi:hypothetical protein